MLYYKKKDFVIFNLENNYRVDILGNRKTIFLGNKNEFSSFKIFKNQAGSRLCGIRLNGICKDL